MTNVHNYQILEQSQNQLNMQHALIVPIHSTNYIQWVKGSLHYDKKMRKLEKKTYVITIFWHNIKIYLTRTQPLVYQFTVPNMKRFSPRIYALCPNQRKTSIISIFWHWGKIYFMCITPHGIPHLIQCTKLDENLIDPLALSNFIHIVVAKLTLSRYPICWQYVLGL